jgi:hypothetical protein
MYITAKANELIVKIVYRHSYIQFLDIVGAHALDYGFVFDKQNGFRV